MGKFEIICIKNKNSIWGNFSKNKKYICEYDYKKNNKFVFIYVNNTYIYCDFNDFNTHFKTLKELRKEKLKKLKNV